MALIVGINAKYVHTSLSIRYLRNAAGGNAQIFECSINDSVYAVSEEIFSFREKHILFSCYLWNIEMVLKICEVLKKADSDIIISLGGPEASFNSDELIKNPYIDHIICGEGEVGIGDFIRNIKPKGVYDFGAVQNLDTIPFPYIDGELEALSDRLIYYETSRGCPYTCAFCLSSAIKGVRFKSVNIVKEEILKFIISGVKLVKLVDRTFNADNKRAVELVEFIKKNSKDTSFHFEVKAESMSHELIESLSTAPKGMFQLEIGVQSTDCHTLSRINRKEDFKKLKEVTERLSKNKNMHLHLDLIAGLPEENLKTFIKSFNDVFSLRPDDLQLGFLKKLHGASITDEDGTFSSFPPYEVISTEAMTYDEIIMLKGVSAVLERIYNSGAFKNTIEHLLKFYETPFEMFFDLSRYTDFKKPISRKNLYELLYKFSMDKFGDERLKGELIYDFCLYNRDYLSFMEKTEEIKEKTTLFVRDEDAIAKHFPEYLCIKPSERYKKIRIEKINEKFYAFDPQRSKAVLL